MASRHHESKRTQGNSRPNVRLPQHARAGASESLYLLSVDLLHSGGPYVEHGSRRQCDVGKNRGIGLNCVVGEIPEEVISALDLYVLLGNAIDNAVECVTGLSDENKKMITLNICSTGGFISIQINNYYEGQLKMQDGFPVTSKSGRYYHGFGLKSIRSIARKYGGDISIDTENNIFTLQIMIPMGKK